MVEVLFVVAVRRRLLLYWARTRPVRDLRPRPPPLTPRLWLELLLLPLLPPPQPPAALALEFPGTGRHLGKDEGKDDEKQGEEITALLAILVTTGLDGSSVGA